MEGRMMGDRNEDRLGWSLCGRRRLRDHRKREVCAIVVVVVGWKSH